MKGMVVGMVDRVYYTSYTIQGSALFEVYYAVCRIMKAEVWNFSIRSLTARGLSVAHSLPVLGMTLH